MSEVTSNQSTPKNVHSSAEIMAAWRAGELSIAQAIPRIMRLITNAKKANDTADIGHGYFMLSFLYTSNNNFSQALPMSQKAFESFKTVNYISRMVAVSIAEGELHRYMGNFAEADTCYRRVLMLIPTIEDSEPDVARANKIFATGNLGHIAYERKDYTGACHLLAKALDILDIYYKGVEGWLTSYEEIYCEYGSTLAESLAQTGDVAAWQQIEKVYVLSKETGRPLEQAFAHRGIALILTTNLTPLDKAWIHDSDYHFEQADNYFSQADHRYEKARTLEYRIESLQKTGELHRAKRLLSDVIQQYMRMGLYERVKRLNQLQQTL